MDGRLGRLLRLSRDDQRAWLLPVGVIAVLGVLLVVAYSRFGMGSSGDSVYYLMGATNIRSGDGYARISGGGELVAISGFPPFFSLTLAMFMSAGLDPVSASRALHASLFASTILLGGGLLWLLTRSTVACAMGCGLIVASPKMVNIFGWVMSEPLYIVLSLIVLTGLIVSLRSSAVWFLIPLGFVAGLATLTRYVGLALVGTGVLAILVYARTSWKARPMYAAVFAAMALLPFSLWLFRNELLVGTATNRQWLFHPMSPELVRTYAEEIAFWIVPESMSFPRIRYRALAAFLIVAPVIALVVLDRRKSLRQRVPTEQGSRDGTGWILAIYAAAYGLALFLNANYLEAATILSDAPRYLLPLYVTIVVLTVWLLHRFTAFSAPFSLSRLGILVVWTGIMIANSVQTIQRVADPIPNLGYPGLANAFADVGERIRLTPVDCPIISNNPELVYVMAQRPAYMIPIRFDQSTLSYREDFDAELQLAQDRLNSGGILILFGHRPLTEHEIETVEILDVVSASRSDLATFYESEHPGAQLKESCGPAEES